MRKKLTIRLGSPNSMFVCRHRPDLKVLGTIQDGLSIGTLAQRKDGCYVQVNGDFERALNTSRITAALQRADHAAPKVRQPITVPIVTVKRRRSVVLPQSASLAVSSDGNALP